MRKYNIYIDFDGVIAKQEGGYKREIGEPIMPMINKVNQWIKDGHGILYKFRTRTTSCFIGLAHANTSTSSTDLPSPDK